MINKGKNFNTTSLQLRIYSEMNDTQDKLLQVLPLGEWDHPAYGKMKIVSEDLDKFVKNFDAGIRRDIPINEGHEVFDEKPAIGWFKKLIAKADGLYAEVEWTTKGLQLLSEKAYKYFSPEFHFEYNDPQTRQDYSNVLVGGALTNKPYFKEMQAVAFSEKNIIMSFNETSTSMNTKTILAKDKSTWTDEEKAFIVANKAELSDDEQVAHKDVIGTTVAEDTEKATGDANEANGLNRDGSAKTETPPAKTQEEIEADHVAAGRNADGTEKTEAPAGEETVTVKASELATFRETAKKLEFKEVQESLAPFIFSDSNKSGKFLAKGKDAVEKFAFSLTKDQRLAFKEIMAHIPSVKVFGEVGSTGEVADGSALKKFNEEAQKLMASDPKLTIFDAHNKVMASNPELKAELAAERAGK